MQNQLDSKFEVWLEAFQALGCDIADSLPPSRRKTVLALVTSRAFLGSATTFAHLVGLRNRQALQRHLVAMGLPPWQILKGWLKALYWCVAWESTQSSICERALLDGHNPSGYYRSIEHATGLPWSEIKQRGSIWIMGELRQQLVGSGQQDGCQTG